MTPQIFKCLLYTDDESIKLKIHPPEFPAAKIAITNNAITDLIDSMASNRAEGLILESGSYPTYRIQSREVPLANYGILDYDEMVSDLEAIKIRDWPGPGSYDRYVHFSEDDSQNREMMIYIEDSDRRLTVHFEEI